MTCSGSSIRSARQASRVKCRRSWADAKRSPFNNMNSTNSMNGIITEIIGPVVDVHFKDSRPAIQDALVIEKTDTHGRIVLEVASHLGLDRVRAISMNETAGLARGEEVKATGAPISVPVGEATLGRLFNVLGETVD